MRVTIHQPEHLPWLGFFDKMTDCDVYVLLDNVQFSKSAKNFQKRNRLIDLNGTVFWSTVPVCMAGHTDKQIADMELDNTQPWPRKKWTRILEAYRHHPYFTALGPELESIFLSGHTLLVDLNLALIEFFRRQLEITVPMVRSSTLDVTGSRSELLLSICQNLGADTYLSGPSGREYLDTDLFEAGGVALDYHVFKHPIYVAPIFQPYLSTLDLLFNHGPESRAILGLST
jgi:hypothetical protein